MRFSGFLMWKVVGLSKIVVSRVDQLEGAELIHMLCEDELKDFSLGRYRIASLLAPGERLSRQGAQSLSIS